MFLPLLLFYILLLIYPLFYNMFSILCSVQLSILFYVLFYILFSLFYYLFYSLFYSQILFSIGRVWSGNNGALLHLGGSKRNIQSHNICVLCIIYFIISPLLLMFYSIFYPMLYSLFYRILLHSIFYSLFYSTTKPRRPRVVDCCNDDLCRRQHVPPERRGGRGHPTPLNHARDLIMRVI